MPDAVRYRPAAFHDVRELAEMRWEFRIEETPGLAARHEREAFVTACQAWIQNVLALGTWTIWLAEAEGRVVSHAFVQLVDKVPRPGRHIDRYGYLTNVYTRPAYRNRGIGGELLEWVKWWALGADLELLLAWPSEEARPIYERAGFSAEDEAMTLILRPDGE